ncbi:MAG: endo-1,4-beta-xylanase, partial [Woeseiaceae bacterium]
MDVRQHRCRPWVALAVVLLAAAGCNDGGATGSTLRESAGKIGFYVGAISGDVNGGSAAVSDPDYAVALTRHFNSLTPENVLKWGSLSPAPDVYDFGPADALVAFAGKNGLRLRGHT